MEVSRHDVVAQLEQKFKDETWNRVALYDISCHEEQARNAKYKWALFRMTVLFWLTSFLVSQNSFPADRSTQLVKCWTAREVSGSSPRPDQHSGS